MPQISPGTSTITAFGFSANVDVYNRSITFNLLPFTTGPNLANRPVCFSVVDQDGVTLASIDFTAPQIANAGATTSWVLDLSSINFAFLFQTYAIYAAIQDVGGQIYQTNTVYPKICEPTNLTDVGYVPGMFQILPDCINSVLTTKEITPLVYNSLQPTSVTKNGNLFYPIGTIAAVPFANTPFSNNAVYTGQYSVQCTTVATYAIGGDIYVLVSYITNNVFPVTCANKMADILCCITKVQQTAIKNCNNAIGANAKQQLQDISVYVMNGLLKEISGQDATFEVDYIKKYLSCDCGSASLSQSEFTPVNPAVNSIVLQGVGGTNIPAPTITGNTKTFNIASNVYQVVKGDTGDLAFTITLNTAISNTVQYIFTFNYDVMAGYILTAIGNAPTLINQLNNLITSTGVNLQGLNGMCVIDLTKSNYSLSQAATGSTLLTNIVINGNTFAAPTNTFANNPTAVASWLNSLTLGTFSATFVGGVLTILSVANTNVISTMTFTNPNVTQQFQATNATLVQVLQAIINYLCNLTSLQIALGNAVALCTLDYNNAIVTTTYQGNTTQAAYNQALANSICNLAARISSLTAFTCQQLQNLFSDNPNAQFSYTNDRFLSVVGGACTNLTAKQAALAIIAAVNADSTTKAAFCAIDCTVPGTCPDVAGINAAPVGGGIGIYGVTWNNNPLASQNVTVKYKLLGSSSYIVANSSLLLLPNGNVSGSSPYVIPGLTAGQTYNVFIGNNCGGVGFVIQMTVPTGTVYSDSFLLGSVIYTVCGGSPVTLYSSLPFATGVTMYTNPGLSTPVTGSLFIVNAGTIYNINPTTGLVGIATGSNCASGTPGTYILGNNAGTICGLGSTTLYTNGAFTPVTGVLYIDSALSTPVTGFAFVVNTSTNHIYNLNTSTGLIGTDTGSLCTSTATLTFSFVNAGGSFLNFQGNLSRAIDGNVNVTELFADGFNNGACSGGAVSSAQSTSTHSILAGSTGVGYNPDLTSGSWASATNYKMYNLIVNGAAHVNGDVIVVGSFSVTIVLPACN